LCGKGFKDWFTTQPAKNLTPDTFSIQSRTWFAFPRTGDNCSYGLGTRTIRRLGSLGRVAPMGAHSPTRKEKMARMIYSLPGQSESARRVAERGQAAAGDPPLPCANRRSKNTGVHTTHKLRGIADGAGGPSTLAAVTPVLKPHRRPGCQWSPPNRRTTRLWELNHFLFCIVRNSSEVLRLQMELSTGL